MKRVYLWIMVILIIILGMVLFILVVNNKKNTENSVEINADEEKITEMATDNSRNNDSSSRNDLGELKDEVLSILAEEKDNYAFYVKDLSDGTEISWNQKKVFYPASIYKVPLAMVILEKIDLGEISFKDKYQVTYEDVAYDYDSLASRVGNWLTVEELLSNMIINSDNTAMLCLENNFGGEDQIEYEIKNKLGVELMKREPHETNLDSVAEIFNMLYNQTFLSETTNEYLLNLMKNTDEIYDDRIIDGLPVGTVAAHKIGTLERTYEDAAIVYGKKDYILIVLNDDVNLEEAASKIQKISEIVYDKMNK